jgi:hypothetical protein
VPAVEILLGAQISMRSSARFLRHPQHSFGHRSAQTLAGLGGFPGSLANDTGTIQVVPFQRIAEPPRGIFQIVALDEVGDMPFLCSFHTILIPPPNTDDQLSFATAFDAQVVRPEEVIQS